MNIKNSIDYFKSKMASCDNAARKHYENAINSMECNGLKMRPVIRQKNAKLFKHGDFVYIDCPRCTKLIGSCYYYTPLSYAENNFCNNCGQAFDWTGHI